MQVYIFQSTPKVAHGDFHLPGDEELPVDKQRGHILNLTSSGEACMAGLTNPETKVDHTGRSEHKNSQQKVDHGG